MKADTRHLALPFFDAAHRALGEQLAAWAPTQQVDESDDRRACRQWVRLLGDAGWLRYCVPASAGGAMDKLDSRALVILRETLAFHSPLADFAFAMQGLGSGAITLAGTPAQQAAYLPAVARGDKIAAFALSEPDAGSDAGAMTTSADAAEGGWALNGSKTWISNGDIADFVGGKADLTARVLRAIGDPHERFAEDHLRMLRAVRFTATLGFALDDATWKAMIAHAASVTSDTSPQTHRPPHLRPGTMVRRDFRRSGARFGSPPFAVDLSPAPRLNKESIPECPFPRPDRWTPSVSTPTPSS